MTSRSPPWQVSFDRKSGYHTHRAAALLPSALFVPIACSFFKTLRLAVSLTDGQFWWTIHTTPGVIAFEAEYGGDAERFAHNLRSMRRARELGRAVLSEHAGYSDLFVPVTLKGETIAFLISGPFSLERPTSHQIIDGFRKLSGRSGRVDDPQFAAYLAAALDVLVLGPGELESLQDLSQCLARLLVGDGRADELCTLAEKHHLELWHTRQVERTWEAASSMIDDRFPRVWHSATSVDQLRVLGLARVPDHVLVGLVAAGRRHEPVEEAVRKHLLQRRAVELAREFKEVIASQIGDHGVAFLSCARGSLERKRRRLLELSERVRVVARRELELELHFGIDLGADSKALGQCHQSALAAAELALTRDERLLVATKDRASGVSSLAELRQSLAKSLLDRPGQVAPRFERYLEAVAQRSPSLEVARLQLDFGLEQLSTPLLESGALDEAGYAAFLARLSRAVSATRTLRDLLDAYRRSVSDLAREIESPRRAARDRNLRQARDFIHDHYLEPLRIEAVARVAGFAADHFSKLFRQREGIAFEHYVRRLRVERAKQLLSGTTLAVERVAELSGFRSPQYFSHAFKAEVGVTPGKYRREPPEVAPDKHNKKRFRT